MTSDEDVLLRGRCQLQFEGQEFVPTGETGSLEDACWLHASPAALEKLASLLGVDESALEFAGWIEIEFYGHLNPVRGHYGHLGGSSREAIMHDVVKAKILKSAG